MDRKFKSCSASKSTGKKNTYSYPVAFVYSFNILIGIGALALPRIFNLTGLVMGTVLLSLVCIIGYITTTYIIEGLAAANAYHKLLKRRREVIKLDTKEEESSFNKNELPTENGVKSNGAGDSVDNTDVQVSATNPMEFDSSVSTNSSEVMSEDDYDIVKNYEFGAMANIFFPRIGIVICYFIVCLNMIGDVTIHAVVATTTFTQTICDLVNYYGNNETYYTIDSCEIGDNETFQPYISECFGGLTKQQVYYIFLTVFYLIMGPFCFFNITKTKLLQIFTNICRYLAFGLLMILTIIRLAQGQSNIPEIADFNNLPTLFGVSVFSFQIHHLLPGVVTPMKRKNRINWLMAATFASVLLFYLILAITGSFAFRACEMNDLFHLDFFNPGDSIGRLVVGTYLALFPFLVLSTRFPLNGIALRENLIALSKEVLKPWYGDKELPKIISRIIFTTLALIPAIVISFSTQQNSLLISVTGAFPGVGIQYFLPAAFVLMGRRTLIKEFGSYHNKHKSPFSHFVIVGAVVVWACVSILLIIVDTALNPPTVEEYPIR